MGGGGPGFFRFDGRGFGAAVTGIFACPDQLPTVVFDWRQQRLGCGIQMEVEPEVDDDEPLQFGIIGLIAPKKAQDKGFLSENGSFQAAATGVRKDWIGSPQSEEVAMHL